MTLFDAPRTFISLCINVSNMVLKHVGGAARHCIVCTFFCVFSFLSQVLTRRGLVTAVSLRLRSLPVEIGREASAACTNMVHCKRTADSLEDSTRAVQTRGARCAERGVPRILCCVCKPNAPPRGTDAKTG
jgi:hypothetical protein